MNGLWPIFKRELTGYFVTPVAYVFIVVFLVLTGVFTFSEELGNFYARGQADLRPFFGFHPWLYLFLIPAVSIELLMTRPISPWGAVAGKYLAAWVFTGIALLLTAPMWITVNVLGEPDNGVIAAGYLGSFLMAGGFLAIGACVSAMTKSQAIAFVLSTVACFVFLLAAFPFVQSALVGWAPGIVTDAVAGLSFLGRFESISKGVVALRDVIFFVALILVALSVNAIILDLKKAT